MSMSHPALPLLEKVQRLRQDVVTRAEDAVARQRPHLARAEFERSACNLAAYLALRDHDLRELQLALMPWGLSSLGRSESRVIPTLDAVLASLGAICGVDASTMPGYPTDDAVFQGSRAIAVQAEAFFGRPGRPERSTCIMVTLPSEAADDATLLRSLLESGMDCVRINCAHDTREVWQAMLENLREAERELGRADRVRVLMDLAGPKVRTRRAPKAEKQRHQSGDRLLLVPEHELDAARHAQKKKKEPLSVVGCTLHEPLIELQVGQHVYIDDGRFAARVVERGADGAVIELLHVPSKGNRIRSDKGLNFPETDFSVSSLTEKDRLDLGFVATHADMIGYSFVQTRKDVDALVGELSAALPEGTPRPSLVLKIETQRAVQNLPELIIQAAGQMPTAVMIARGDLAIELGFQRIAEMQEEILWLCEAAHVPVIWATQVLEGLAKEGLPTRAEVTDAAMANRAECVMLNKGPHIAEAVQLLDEVLTRMEGHQHKKTPQLRALRAWSER